MRPFPGSLWALAPLLTVAAALSPMSARAQAASDAPRPVETAPSQAQSERPIRLRASHRVDVIAPGEHVESVIDRMRANRPLPQGAQAEVPAQGGQRPPMRGPDKRPDRDGPPDDSHGGNGPRPPPGAGPDRPHR